MVRTEESLSPLDATFLELEQADEGALMHIGAGLVFDPPQAGSPPTFEQVIELLEHRVPLLPAFRRVLSDQRVHGLRRPSWVEDPRFDLAAHVRHATLPAGGGEREIHEWLGDFWSHRLDRARPLWEMALVDGLQDGRWMLATKTHHAMVDGVGSVDVGHVLLDAEPHPAPRPDPAPPGPAGAGSPGLPGWLSSAVDAARAAAGAARHPRHTLEDGGHAAAAMGEALWENEVHAARPSTLNVPIGSSRSFASATFELADVKDVKQRLGGTVNDVVLAVCTGALRRLLEHRGEDLGRPLRAMVPVNLRGDDHGVDVTNRVSSLFVDLPIGEPDARSRYEQMRAGAGELKAGSGALGTSAIIFVAGLVPPILHESIATSLYASRLFNITITNVPGPQMPLYALGARLRRAYPLVPLAAGHALGLAVASYDGEIVFGVNADRAAMPDLDLFVDALCEALAQLREL